jgi:hypothetical protein
MLVYCRSNNWLTPLRLEYRDRHIVYVGAYLLPLDSKVGCERSVGAAHCSVIWLDVCFLIAFWLKLTLMMTSATICSVVKIAVAGKMFNTHDATCMSLSNRAITVY